MTGRYGASRRELAARAAHLVERLAREIGCQVRGRDLREAWREVYGEPLPPPVERGRWPRILEPAVREGRVTMERVGERYLYSPAGQALPRPTSGRPRTHRRFSEALQERARRGEAAVRAATKHHGRAVTGPEWRAFWEAVHGEPLEPSWWDRLDRLLEPSVQEGRILRRRKGTRRLYVPAEAAHLPDPQYLSDSARVREAVRRAAGTYESAVPHDVVALELQVDPELRLQGNVPLGTLLSGLRQRGEIHGIRLHDRGPATRWYYYPRGTSYRVRREVRLPMDQRWDVIQGFWRSNGGLPFTTRALRRYARRTRPDLFQEEPYHAWTLALHHLERWQKLIKLERRRRRYALWAPREEWLALAETERQTRLRDVLRDSASPAKESVGDFALRRSLDPPFVSKNNDMRALFGLAQERRAAAEADEERRRLMAARPLTCQDVDAWVPADHPLRPTGPLAVALKEAARLRPGMIRSELVQVGLHRGRAYYALEDSGEATAFVAFRRALEAVDVRALRRASEDLEQSVAARPAAALPVAGPIVRARRDALWAKIRYLEARLRRTRAEAAILVEERDAAEERLEELAHLAGRLEALERALPAGPPPEAPSEEGGAEEALLSLPTYDLHEAWQEVSRVERYALATGRALPSRLKIVPAVPAEGPAEAPAPGGGRGGRAKTTDFDRLRYAAYAMERWCGPRLRVLAGLAASTMGELRRLAPFLEALEGDDPAEHAAAVAVLALFDTSEAREALATYLEAFAEAPEARSRSAPAAEFAALGLLPLPFGGQAAELAPREAQALEVAARNASDQRVAQAAQLTERVWQGGVGPEEAAELYGLVWWVYVEAAEEDGGHDDDADTDGGAGPDVREASG